MDGPPKYIAPKSLICRKFGLEQLSALKMVIFHSVLILTLLSPLHKYCEYCEIPMLNAARD